LSVNLTQRADESASVFAADFAIPVAVATVETCLAHAALHYAHTRKHPPAGAEWQLNYAREIMFYARYHDERWAPKKRPHAVRAQLQPEACGVA
jgi:hypothetical protein